MDTGTELSDLMYMVMRHFFEKSGEGAILVDKNGVIMNANPASGKIFGYKNKMIGLSIENLIPDHLRSGHSKYRNKFESDSQYSEHVMKHGMTVDGLKSDGSVTPVEINLFRLPGDKEQVLAIVKDVRSRTNIEKELQELNRELEQRVQEQTVEVREGEMLSKIIARHFPNGTINVFDKNLKYIYAEGKELYDIGVSSEKLKGTGFLEHLDKSIRDDTEDKLMQVFNGQPLRFTVKSRKQYYELNAVPLPSIKGIIDKILVVETNVTKRERAQDNILKALEKEKKLNELKSRFVSLASHEFRTPLQTILSSSSLVRKYLSDNIQDMNPVVIDKITRHLVKIQSSVNNLNTVLNDFLSFDRIEAGTIQVKPSEFRISELIREALEEVDGLCKPGQKMVYKHKSKSDKVVLDLQLTKNILLNLLSNAIKYSPEESSIEVESLINEKQLHLKIKDNGIGIPREEHAYMFQRFFRAANAVNLQGTGLGLNIVKNHLDLMQGCISFESELNEGSTFYITLPDRIEPSKNNEKT